ncbi:unnamed protein product [Trichobilharzia regenti]|nr:unnamed protein product [Trichobilharzia regenti]
MGSNPEPSGYKTSGTLKPTVNDNTKMANMYVAKSTPMVVVNTTNKKSTTGDDKRHSQEKPLNTTKHKPNKFSSLQDAVEKLDLNHLSEEERNKVLDVIKKDFEVRAKEQERLK